MTISSLKIIHAKAKLHATTTLTDMFTSTVTLDIHCRSKKYARMSTIVFFNFATSAICENMEMDITALALKNSKMTQKMTVIISERDVQISMAALNVKAF